MTDQHARQHARQHDRQHARPHVRRDAREALLPILSAMAVGIAILLVASLVLAPLVEAVAPFLLLVATAASAYLVRTGRVAAASHHMIVALLVTGVIAVGVYGSMRSATNVTFLGAVVVAGIFLGRRAMLAVAGVTSAVVGALIYAESSGWMRSINRPTGMLYWLIFSLALVLFGLAVHFARTVALDALERQDRELDERARAEAAAYRSEERLRLSMAVSRQGWFDLNLQTGEVVASEQFASLVGDNPDQPPMSLQTWMDSIHADDRSTVLRAYGECLGSGVTRQIDYRMRTRTAEWLWVRSMARVVQYDAAGRPMRLTGTHADITDHVRATAALRESELRYRTLVELSPIGLLVHRDGQVAYANPAALALLGAPAARNVIGVSTLDLVHPESRDSVRECFERTAAGSSAESASEQRFVRLDGEPFDVSFQAVPITFEGARVLQVIFTDVSERKDLEALRLRAQKLQSLGTLAGGIAHDFNNILSAIRGNAELAAEELGHRHPAAESLAEIQRAGSRASELVRRLSAFGRPLRVTPMHVDLRQLVQEVVTLMRPTVPDGIAMPVRSSSDVPSVLADAALVQECVVNLATNAVHAIGETDGTIASDVDAVDLSPDQAARLSLTGSHFVRVRIADSGCGMDEPTIARIFDAFFTTKPVGTGSGLGLSMVYGCMRSHGGAVSVDSSPGRGTSFELYFPVGSSAAGGHAASSTPPPAATW